jgi:hypothetical protein
MGDPLYGEHKNYPAAHLACSLLSIVLPEAAIAQWPFYGVLFPIKMCRFLGQSRKIILLLNCLRFILSDCFLSQLNGESPRERCGAFH